MEEHARVDPALSAARDEFYQMHRRNLSNTSLDSEALLDHREQAPFAWPRRPTGASSSSVAFQSPFQFTQGPSRLRTVTVDEAGEDDDEEPPWGEGTPLLSHSAGQRGSRSALTLTGYGSGEARGGGSRPDSRASSKKKLPNPFASSSENYNVNYPPSVPASPQMRPLERMDMSFGDIMLREELSEQDSPRRGERSQVPEHLLQPSPLDRRRNLSMQAHEDGCYPHEGLSEMADDELRTREEPSYRTRSRKRRGKWPDLGILDEWSRFEKEGRSEERRAKKITEPQLINGRLRPIHKGWFRAEEDAPYRFTYFNEDVEATIHSHSISELVQPGGSFRELFLPDPPLLSDSEDDEEEEPEAGLHRGSFSINNGDSKVPTREPSLAANPTQAEAQQQQQQREGNLSPSQDRDASRGSREHSGTATPLPDPKSPSRVKSPLQAAKAEKPLKYGERPVWWLDVLSPTEAEMRVISKAFGIHPLTAEDIMMQEAREKVELFRHYYFVSYRSFDQDQSSETFLDPVHMYVVVFREGILSFHFSMTPTAANVRRRIRQLREYMAISSDWISYAIIDDITDAFVPLIQNIEDEVDDIDETILKLHSSADLAAKERKAGGGGSSSEGKSLSSSAAAAAAAESDASSSDMLYRVGDARKKVMTLYRLLSNKADVIKGFAKRCNEHWEVAPRSEIGLYLGDIQDHIVTMTANLSHYEKILARAHGNYLAQINIRMNERQEQTADVLGKLTVLGTIVLPMNIITGLWGMNVWVPGQEFEGDLNWFVAITAGLLLFGFACYMIAKRVYMIV